MTTAQPPDQGPGQEDDDLDAKRAEAAAKLSELMAKLHDAQSRLDAMIAESRKLQEKLREIHLEEDGPSSNGV